MNPLEVTFHLELTHFIEKKRSSGTAKKIITFVPHAGMVIGSGELLTVEQVQWLGHNNFAIHLHALAQVPRANPADVNFADLQALKDEVSKRFKHLDWDWKDETTG